MSRQVRYVIEGRAGALRYRFKGTLESGLFDPVGQLLHFAQMAVAKEHPEVKVTGVSVRLGRVRAKRP